MYQKQTQKNDNENFPTSPLDIDGAVDNLKATELKHKWVKSSSAVLVRKGR